MTEQSAERSTYLSQVRWRNFRSFKDTGWIELRPMTVLLGANNSGKTSALLPLLMMKQTLDSKDKAVPIVGSGSIVDAGAFRDFVHNHDMALEVGFNLRYAAHDHVTHGEPRALWDEHPGGFDVTFVKRDSITRLGRTTIFDCYNRSLLSRKLLASGRYSLRGKDVTEAALFGKADNPAERAFRKVVREDTPDNFLFTAYDAYVAALREASKNGQVGDWDPSRASAHYMNAVEYTHDSTTRFLRRIYYVGPLRDRPRRIYNRAMEQPLDVGYAGERTPEMLLRSSQPERSEIARWLKRFDLAAEVAIREHDETNTFSIELRPQGGSAAVNITDAGFGYSQVLPVLVQGIVSPANATLIYEQPEIHLNPRLQVELASFFVDLALDGKTVLVETHSDHLIFRLQRLVAEGRIASAQVAVYFVEREPDGGSRVRAVGLNDDGTFDSGEWPEGFFSEPITEAIATTRAQLGKSTAE